MNWKRTISCYRYSFLELLALRINFFNKLLIGWRKPVYLKEIKMANISEKDKVLHIGSGILPYASILIAEETNARVVGIDNNKQALKLAQRFVDKKGFSDRITIEYGDGARYPMQDFDVIFIAINVWPIDTILEHIASQMKQNARILCKSINNDVIEILEKGKLSNVLSVKSKQENPKTQSFLLTKK